MRSMVKTGSVAFGETLLAKILPLAIVIPLWLRIQTFIPEIQIQFSIEQGAYMLAIGIIVVVAIIEFRISQGAIRGFDSLNLGSGLALFIMIAGLIILGWIIATDVQTFSGASTFNDIVSAYLGFSILVIGIQALREITGVRKELKRQGSSIF